MFVGHFGVGLAAKKLTPRISLPVLFIACQLLDFIWPVAMFAGLESAAHNHSLPTYNSLELVYAPYSHSLGMTLIWSLLFGLLVKHFSKSTTSAWVTGGVVFSHWILDWITHIPDLPLWFGAQKVGLGLWKSRGASFALEAPLFALGIYLYLKARGKMRPKQLLTFCSMILFLSFVYLLSTFGSKPPETTSPYLIAGPAFALWLIVLWAHYVDKESS